MALGGTKANAVSYIDGDWYEGNPPIMGPLTHAAWLGSIVFDGARAFDGTTPDLDRHAERCVHSARSFLLDRGSASNVVAPKLHRGEGRFTY